MFTIIIGVLIIMSCAFVLGFIFAPDDFPRLFCGVWLSAAVFSVSCTVGIVLIVLHFASKYW